MQMSSRGLSLNSTKSEVIKLNAQHEAVEKQRADEQWNKYHRTMENKEGKNIRKPSKKQIAYIVSLARSVGLRIDIAKIDSNVKASSLIERLKLLSRQMNGNSAMYELRDKKVTFGMATKLVFKKYLDRHRDYRKSKSFWKEVEEFYRQYQEKQAIAIRLPLKQYKNGRVLD